MSTMTHANSNQLATDAETPPGACSASCPECGASVPIPGEGWAKSSEARSKIQDLELKVRNLDAKAIHANSKLALYEEELLNLRASGIHTNSFSPGVANVLERSNTTLSGSVNGDSSALASRATDTTTAAAVAAPARSAVASRPAATLGRSLTTTSRIANLLTRRQVPASPVPSTPTSANGDQISSPSAPELSAALDREQLLRKAAESKLHQTNSEVEELSASLFQQANEMVAVERKARHQAEAKLEAKSAELEAKTLELETKTASQRGSRARRWTQESEATSENQSVEDKERTKADNNERTRTLEKRCKFLEERVRALETRELERGKRLERLERAMGRVGRVKGLLNDGMLITK